MFLLKLGTVDHELIWQLTCLHCLREALTLALGSSRSCISLKNANSLKRISDNSTSRSSPQSRILHTQTYTSNSCTTAAYNVWGLVLEPAYTVWRLVLEPAYTVWGLVLEPAYTVLLVQPTMYVD